MPSAKFTESEVLEPSESFRERKKISEIEADLRAYFGVGRKANRCRAGFMISWICFRIFAVMHAVFYPFSAQPQAALMSRSAACMTL